MKMHCKINVVEDQVNTKEDHDCFVAWMIERMIHRGHSFIQSSQSEILVIVEMILSTILTVVWEITPWHVKRLDLIGRLTYKRKTGISQ